MQERWHECQTGKPTCAREVKGLVLCRALYVTPWKNRSAAEPGTARPGALCVANDLFSERNPEYYENAQITLPMSAMLTIQ